MSKRAVVESMTGFSCHQADLGLLGKVTVELRSTNHKFLEVVLHLPEGFLALEEPLRKEIEARIPRGRIICAITMSGTPTQRVEVNETVARMHVQSSRQLQKHLGVKGDLTIDTLMQLPGVVSLMQSSVARTALWPRLRGVVREAVESLVAVRRREGAAMMAHIRRRTVSMSKDVERIRARFSKLIKERTAALSTDEERSSFLKNSDITEEIDRVSFHVRNVLGKIARAGALGKELDFIAQEMQREINTIGAKSCDAAISAMVVEIKSTIEKIREQAQNIV
jgi:uncharacterized protein (TIGR00255 family)